MSGIAAQRYRWELVDDDSGGCDYGVYCLEEEAVWGGNGGGHCRWLVSDSESYEKSMMLPFKTLRGSYVSDVDSLSCYDFVHMYDEYHGVKEEVSTVLIRV